MSPSIILEKIRSRQCLHGVKNTLKGITMNKSLIEELAIAHETIQQLYKSLEIESMTGAIALNALKKVMQDTSQKSVVVNMRDLPSENQLLDVDTATLTLVGFVDDVAAKVKKVISSQLGFHPDLITNEKVFVTDLQMDSLDEIELAMAIEETFDLEIPDEDAEKLTSVQSTIDYVMSRVNNKAHIEII